MKLNKKTIWADHQITPFFSRGGKLIISDFSLVFKPHYIDKVLLFAKKIIISFEDIEQIEINKSPFHLVDDLIVRLKDDNKYWFRIKKADDFTNYLRGNNFQILIQEMNKSTNKYLAVNKKKIITELVFTFLTVFPTIMFISVMYGIISQIGIPNSFINFFNYISGSGYIGFFIFSVCCLLVTIPIIMFRIISSKFALFLKVSFSVLLVVASIIVVPIFHFYFLREKYSSLYRNT